MLAPLGRLCPFATLSALFFLVLLAPAAEAADPRAGTAKWPVGATEVTVKFTKPMPSEKYSVAVMPYVPKLGGYSPVSVCTYFGTIVKLTKAFTVQHKRCTDGAPIRVDENFLLDWIVAEWTE